MNLTLRYEQLIDVSVGQEFTVIKFMTVIIKSL